MPGLIGTQQVFEDAVTQTALNDIAVGDTVLDKNDTERTIIGKVTSVLNPIDLITINFSDATSIACHPEQYFVLANGQQVKAKHMQVLMYLTATVYVDNVDATPDSNSTFIELILDAGTTIKTANESIVTSRVDR